MLEILLRPPKLTYSACRPFAKNKECMQKFKETGYSEYIYQIKLEKNCFQDTMSYGEFEDLPRRTAAGKILHCKVFNIAKTQNIMDINADLLQWFINLLIQNFKYKQRNIN